MASQEVYLDHLIKRENLRYKRSTIPDDADQRGMNVPPTLRISDLIGNHISSRGRTLRKPDFQRPTWAWTPDDCVLLLDSLIKSQVIPSIIMWSSKDSGYDFILDGAHRISVVMAWLLDDWGDNLSEDEYGNEQRAQEIKSAANAVRKLVDIKIGSFESYRLANEEFERIVEEGLDVPRKVMDSQAFEKAQFYRKIRSGIGFHILWVSGNYETAEKSFLKINKSGKSLDEWETKLIENRNSSFARAIMSLANIDSVEYYWPTATAEEIPDIPTDKLVKKIGTIISGVQSVEKILLKPNKPAFVNKLTLPLMDIPERFKRPFWIAEFLTIVEGYQGTEIDTRKLLARGANASPVEIIDEGQALITRVNIALEHLIGSTQRSLNVVPALYFYTNSGRYIRSILYGFSAWLLSGSDDDVLTRKRIFASYRDAFEKVLFDRKEDLATGLTRSVGSGPEITKQTAIYFDSLMTLLINHRGNIYNDAFREDYSTLVKKTTGKKPSISDLFQSKSRTFTSRMKAEKMMATVISHAPPCGICKGIMDLEIMDVQHDHVEEWAKGGKTSPDNQRIVHPFCNNHANRQEIERIKSGQENVRLPYFAGGEDSLLKQLNFFSELKYQS